MKKTFNLSLIAVFMILAVATSMAQTVENVDNKAEVNKEIRVSDLRDPTRPIGKTVVIAKRKLKAAKAKAKAARVPNVQAVFIRGSERFAWVSGKLVAEGKRTKGFLLQTVEPEYVEFKSTSGRIHTVNLLPNKLENKIKKVSKAKYYE